MVESAFNRPIPVQEQQAALKAEPRTTAREAYEIGKEQEAEAAAQAEALENALHDDETPTAPQEVIDALIADENDVHELTAEEASRAIEAAMQERTMRFEGTIQGNPVVSDPSLPPGFIGAVRLTAEQLEATKHLKPGEAWAKAGEALEPEPRTKPEDLDGF